MIKALILGASTALIPLTPAFAQMVSDPSDEAAFESAMAHNNVMTVRNVTRTEIVSGLWIYDAAGKAIGKVDHLAGNDVVVSRGSRQYVLSFTELFAYNQYGKDYFATRQSKEVLDQQALVPSKKSKR